MYRVLNLSNKKTICFVVFYAVLCMGVGVPEEARRDLQML